MKIKIKYFSLVLFVLFQLALTNMSNKLEKLSRSGFKSHSLSHKDHNKLKDHKIGKIHHKDHKDHHKDHLKLRTLRENKPKSSEGFFAKTSKKNQSTAAQALSAFVLGIILFICSIHFICWNERRAVKETEFIDFIRHEKKCVYLENGKLVEDKPENENKVFVVNGLASVEKEATIENLPLTVTTPKGKICVIRTVYEKFSKEIKVVEEEVGEDNEGNTLMKAEETTTRNWYKTDYTNNRFTSKYHYGEVLIAGRYSFPMENLNAEVEKNQTSSLADNFYIYKPTDADIPTLEEYFKIENSDPSKPYKYYLKDQYVYILRANIPEAENFEFNPETYEFSDADIRMTVKFFYVPNEDTFYTAAGGLGKDNEKGIKQITSYLTNLKRAGCSYFCCCCAEDEKKYEVNLLYTKKMTRDEIVLDLETQNKTCTCFSRIGGFLMHFLSIYLILYPLILLVGMIPFLGAIGATILIFFAFILSLMTFLFIIACAWICARPVYAVLIFGFIFILFFVGKTSKDHLDTQDGNENRGGYYQNGGYNNFNSGNSGNPGNSGNNGNAGNSSLNTRPKRKFL
jgi:hypothetical protein